MIEKLRELAEAKIKGASLGQKELIAKYKTILALLEDDAIFFKLPVEDAYAILTNLEIEERDAVYKSLISPSSYKTLQDQFEL